jgi:ABC-2 type transport system permease protein
MNTEIRQGTLAMRLLRPIHPVLSYAADNLAALPIRAALAFPVAMITLYVVGRGHLAQDPVLWLIVPFAVIGAWVISFSMMFLIGTLGLFWESSLAVWDLWFGCYIIFSGYLMPLSLLPPWIGKITRLSPFPYMLAFPVEACLGNPTRSAAATSLGVEWLYAAGFFTAALFLWKRGLVRFAAYGG